MVNLSFKWSHFSLWGPRLQVIRVVLCNSADRASHHLRAPSSRRFNLQGGRGGGDTASLPLLGNLRAEPRGQLLIRSVHSDRLSSRRRPSLHTSSSSALWLIAAWSLTKPNRSDFPSVSQLPKWTGHALFLSETKRQACGSQGGRHWRRSEGKKRLRAAVSVSFFRLELTVWQSSLCWVSLRSLGLFKTCNLANARVSLRKSLLSFFLQKQSKVRLFIECIIQPANHSLVPL